MHGRVAVVILDNPPVNGLGHAVRAELVSAVERAEADAACDAIVITGAGRFFSGGADIKEFNTPRATAEPTLHTAIRVVESCAKPVVAAINGTCMGGGLELALACHYRVAAAQALLALPEVKIGLLPGAGGTQRLPRAVGVETALNMIVSGEGVAARALAGTALLDQVADGDTMTAACALASAVVAEHRPRKRLRDIAIAYPNLEAFLQFARNTVAPLTRHYPAPAKCIDAVGAAVTLPFDEGLAFERRLFLELVQTPESRAL